MRLTNLSHSWKGAIVSVEVRYESSESDRGIEKMSTKRSPSWLSSVLADQSDSDRVRSKVRHSESNNERGRTRLKADDEKRWRPPNEIEDQRTKSSRNRRKDEGRLSLLS